MQRSMLVTKITSLLLNNSLSINQAKQLHAQILINNLNLLKPQLFHHLLSSPKPTTTTTTTTHYINQILNHTQNLNPISISHTIRILTQHNQFFEAISLYSKLQTSGLTPTTFAISSALKCCAKSLYNIFGILIHAQVFKYGFCNVVYVETALVDFYSKIGGMVSARKLFDEMCDRKNVVTWNTMISGYVRCGDLVMARNVFDEMQKRDVISWNTMVSGYGKAGKMEEAYGLFKQMPDRSLASWNVMISGYLDCGEVELARSLFDAMPDRNNVSYVTMISGYSKHGDVESAREIFGQLGEKDLFLYNAMIACYAQNGRAKDALQLFNEMLRPNVDIQPDKMTLASAISACSQLGDLKFGVWIESYMSEIGIRMDDHLATSLIDLYAKSGRIDKAYELFYCLKKKDLVAYTAMILGCGINGRENDAITLFEEMMVAEINPNLATFTGILTAYNNVGLVEEGYRCFRSMQKYGLVPSVDHYAIMVELLGRAGWLEEAQNLIKSMPMEPHAGVWGALLLGCSLHNSLELGEIAARHCFELEPDSTGYHSLLANIYASAERWDDAKKLRKDVEATGFTKVPGSSWIS